MFWRKRKQREQDLERELRSDLELEAEEQRENGITAEDAHYAARRAFGNMSLTKEDVREMWRWTKLEQLIQDFRYASRILRKSPGFVITAVFSLALGIGANTAIFTVVNGVLLRPLPFPHPDRLVQLWETKPSKDYFRNVVNPFNFLDWRERTHSFEGMAAVTALNTNLTGLGDPVALQGMQVSPNFFSVLGVSPATGRSFLPEEGVPGHDHVAVLSFALWQSRFGGDPSIIGRKITVDGEPSTVIGVMPRGFRLPQYTPDIWTPLPIVRSKEWEGGRFLQVIARLKPGISLEQAQQDLARAARQNAIERPASDKGWSAEAIPMLTDATEEVRLPLLVLLGAVGLVLLIACANVANLLLMRAAGRLREVAIRAALGAGRRRLLQQMLSESLLLAFLACAAGLAFAYVGVKALIAMIPAQTQFPRIDAIHIDGRVLLFALGVSVASALIFGLVPAFQVSQVVPHETLQIGAIRTAAKSILRQALVVVEIAVSLVLLFGAGLMLHSFHRLTSVDLGFEIQHILTMRMFTSPAKYANDHARADYFARLLDNVRAVPGVKAAGSVHFLPLEGENSGSCFTRVEDGPPVPSTSPGADFLVISPGYFEAMGTPLVSGRFFGTRDRFGTRSVIMVNQQFVKRFLPDRNPIGQTLNVCWPVKNPAEIVGVVADARQTELQTAPKPTIFIDNLQAPMYFSNLVVRTTSDPVRMMHSIEAAIHRVNPDQPLTHIKTMDQVFSDGVAQPRLELILLLVFGGIAALLAIVGIYGVVAYSVAQRTREIGIRVAIGAQQADVSRMVLREGAALAVAGALIGTAGALMASRVLRTLLFQTAPTDPVTLGFVVVLVIAVALLATVIPARRAAQVDAMTALRYE
jgi:putative ABC transport system permease protein